MPKSTDSLDAYIDTVNRLEPDITPIDTTAALASIAISLKRIADVLENNESANQLEEAIIRAIDAGANNAISTWQRRR